MPFNRWSETRQNWALAWPIMVSQLAQVATGFVDSTMAGHASVLDLAAVSVGSSVWIALMVTMIGILYASSPLISQRVGAEEFDAVPELVRQSLWQGLILAGVMMLAVLLIAPVFTHLGLVAEAAVKAQQFLYVVSFGLPALAVVRSLTAYSNSLNHSKPPMVIALISLLLNIPLNWMFIYGHGPFPALGGVGCAYATAICMWFSAIGLGVWVKIAPYYQSTQPFARWSWPQWDLQKQLLVLGGPIGLVFLVEVSAFTSVGLLIARLGAVSVAAHQIAFNFTALIFMAPSALGSALTVRVGQALGAKDAALARFIGGTGIRMGLAYALVSGIAIIVFALAISRLYSPDLAVQALAATLLMYAGIFQFADASQVVIAGILRGHKITREPMLIYIAAFWLIGLPGGYALAEFAGLGVKGYWIGLVLALFFAATLLYLLFRRISLSTTTFSPPLSS